MAPSDQLQMLSEVAVSPARIAASRLELLLASPIGSDSDEVLLKLLEFTDYKQPENTAEQNDSVRTLALSIVGKSGPYSECVQFRLIDLLNYSKFSNRKSQNDKIRNYVKRILESDKDSITTASQIKLVNQVATQAFRGAWRALEILQTQASLNTETREKLAALMTYRKFRNRQSQNLWIRYKAEEILTGFRCESLFSLEK
jgi:hypothetical protein